MSPYQEPSLEAIKAARTRLEAQIKAAFADVALDGGIGYYEANAIDDYLKPHEEKYQQAVAKDRATSWIELLELLKDEGNLAVPCFMDMAGLYYYLPVLLCAPDECYPEFFFEPWGQERALALLSRLTPLQWEALLDFYVFEADREGNVDFLCTPDPGTPCSQCGKIHSQRAALTRAEAEAQVEAYTDCQIWRRLQVAYLQAHPESARTYLDSPRAESRQYLFDTDSA